MRILGIDPGLATIGLGLIESNGNNECQAEDWLIITTESSLELADRLNEIASDLSKYLKETQPDLVVVEKLYFATNEKTAMDVAQARGVIMQAVNESGIQVLEVTPLELKSSITGDGQADKTQICDMVVHSLKLEETPTPDDAADALALALYGAFSKSNL